jgi:hypothetical protein
MKAFTALLLCFAGFVSAWGQTGVELTVNRNPVRQGSDLQVTMTFRNCSGSPAPLRISGLEYRFGPATSHSTSWVNGVITSSSSLTWTYRVTSGTDVSIPGYEVETDKGKMRTSPFVVRVQAGGAAGATAGTAPQGGGQAQGGQVQGGKPAPAEARSAPSREVTAVVEISDRKAYVGEPLVATMRIYTRVNGLDVRSYELPDFPGFWKETVSIPDPAWEAKVIDGQRYNVATVGKVVLFPQQVGKQRIDGFTLEGFVRRSFFGGQNVTVTSDPVTVDVLPYPKSAPANHLGTFKRLQVSVKSSATACAANEAVTVEYTFSGEGNLKFIKEPDLVWPADFEVFDPEVIDAISITGNGESGRRTFRYVAIPRVSGTYTLPTLSTSWFNPSTATFVAVSPQAPTLEVSRATGDPAATMTYNAKTDVQQLNQDVRFIRESPSRGVPRGRLAYRNLLLGSALLLGPAGFAAAWAARRRRQEALSDAVGYRSRQAGRTAARALRLARLQLQDPPAFHAALGPCLEHYLGAKLRIPPSRFTRADVTAALAARAPHLAARWDAALEEADRARFAPGSVDAPEAMLERATTLIHETEQAWKS